MVPLTRITASFRESSECFRNVFLAVRRCSNLFECPFEPERLRIITHSPVSEDNLNNNVQILTVETRSYGEKYQEELNIARTSEISVERHSMKTMDNSDSRKRWQWAPHCQRLFSRRRRTAALFFLPCSPRLRSFFRSLQPCASFVTFDGL